MTGFIYRRCLRGSIQHYYGRAQTQKVSAFDLFLLKVGAACIWHALFGLFSC